MKKIITILIFIKTCSLHAQNIDTLNIANKPIAQTKDNKIKAFYLNGFFYITFPHQKDRFMDEIYKNKSDWDTILISSFMQREEMVDEVNKTFFLLDSCTLKTLKDEKIGLNAIIITQYLSSSEHCLGETFDYRLYHKLKLMEVWDLDNIDGNQDRLFSAKSFYSEFFSQKPTQLSLYDRGNNKTDTAKIIYKYDVTIKENGDILIENLTEPNKDPLIVPDHKEGLYKYDNYRRKYYLVEK